jgi:hypothetical protein
MDVKVEMGESVVDSDPAYRLNTFIIITLKADGVSWRYALN